MLREKLPRTKSDCPRILDGSCTLSPVGGANPEETARKLQQDREMGLEALTTSKGVGSDDFNHEDLSSVVRSLLLEPIDLIRDISLEMSLLSLERVKIFLEDLDPLFFGSCDLHETWSPKKTTKKTATKNTTAANTAENIAKNEKKNNKNEKMKQKAKKIEKKEAIARAEARANEEKNKMKEAASSRMSEKVS